MALFVEVFDDATKHARKIQTTNYAKHGMHPIIDQGQAEIAGYTDEVVGLFENVPAIIFGDHTRVIKYVDNTIVNTSYFCEFFNSDTAQYELQGKRNQSTQAYLKANHVEDLILPLPPMKLQEQFAAFVEQTDKTKLSIQQSLTQLETLKASLMQLYFG